MKNVICVLGFILTICFFENSAQAQFSLSPTVGLQAPTGQFGARSNTGFGFALTGRYMLSENFATGFMVGLNTFKGTVRIYEPFPIPHYSNYPTRSVVFPMAGIFEYHYPMGFITPFAGSDMGLYLSTYKFSSTKSSNFFFGFSPKVGAIYPFTDAISFTADMKVNIYFNNGGRAWIGVNAGICYNL